MRLKTAQPVLLINREASQAERRRFEPGHPLFKLARSRPKSTRADQPPRSHQPEQKCSLSSRCTWLSWQLLSRTLSIP